MPNPATIHFDGLIVRSDGWNHALEASGLHGIHVTAADWVGDYAATTAGVRAWNDILTRQADRFFALRTADDLDRLGTDGRVGVLFGLQDSAPLETDLDRVGAFWELGIRVLQLTYNKTNALGHGCTIQDDTGLTAFGGRVVAECNRLGILVDLSHVGRQTSLDAIAASDAPVAVTHANRHAVVANPRNKPDDVLRAVADSDGVIGVTPWAPMCWRGGGQPGVADFMNQLVAMVELVGVDAVAIGTDLPILSDAATGSQAILDRSVASHPEIFAAYVEAVANTTETRYCAGFTQIDAWAELPEWLAGAGFDRAERDGLLGGNWLRLLHHVLAPNDLEHAA